MNILQIISHSPESCPLGKPKNLELKMQWLESLEKNAAKHNIKVVGVWTFWYDDGQKREERSYYDDERIIPNQKHSRSDGPTTLWYQNGQKKSEGCYKAIGTKDISTIGKWTDWYQNGQKKSEGCYEIIDNFPSKEGIWIWPDPKS